MVWLDFLRVGFGVFDNSGIVFNSSYAIVFQVRSIVAVGFSFCNHVCLVCHQECCFARLLWKYVLDVFFLWYVMFVDEVAVISCCCGLTVCWTSV